MKKRQKNIELKYSNPMMRSSSNYSNKDRLNEKEMSGRKLYAKYETENSEHIRPITCREKYDDNELWAQQREDKLHELRRQKLKEEETTISKPRLNKKYNQNLSLSSFDDRQKAFEARRSNSRKDI